MSLLGLDIGTTGVKAVAFREDGACLSSAYREYDLTSPRPGLLELDPHVVLRAVREVTGQVSAELRRDPPRSIAACTMGEAAVPVDAQHRPVGNAIAGFDSRGEEEAAQIREKLSDEEVFSITGHTINGAYTLFKVLWRRRHDPELFRRAKKFLCFGDFTVASMGLPPRTEHSIASRTLAFDVHRRVWSDRILAAAGLDAGIWAPPAAPGEPLGELGSNDFGLPPGCVVAAGLHDQPAGILGSAVRPGESMLATGTVICLGVRLKRRPEAEVMIPSNLCYYPTFGTEQYISIAYNFTGGSLLKWYRDRLGGEEVAEAKRRGVDPFEVICEALPEAPTRLMVLPHFATTGTPWLDAKARGAVLGLSLATTRKEIVKAVLEGVVYEVKLNSEILAQAGVEIAQYRAIGGAARSPVWMQIAADILDRPVAILGGREVAALGAALMGARASGLLKTEGDVQSFAERCAHVKAVFEPRREHARRYAERFAVYRDVYPRTRDISHRLFDLNGA
jgi:xylulokinase